MRCVLNESSYIRLPMEFTLELLQAVLTLNHFRFEQSWFQQISGPSMGAVMAPNYANRYMYCFERQHPLTPHADNIALYRHFIADMLIIWKGDENSINNIIDEINTFNTPIQLTITTDMECVNFLDVCI
ncbi:Hypothetical predicted protein [Pelobates cultripes]|uniref:Reverse transcriptase domain-containing protein n=1 Tax=Pelobates cultripes TaxID=61616 RepID=A0AAD1SBS2_PELCU|nr:Hypothetical predicted protein [Pelobates cultripes]